MRIWRKEVNPMQQLILNENKLNFLISRLAGGNKTTEKALLLFYEVLKNIVCDDKPVSEKFINRKLK